MSKMHYFSKKFSKIAKHWGLSAPSAFYLQYWWPEVPWFDQKVVFEADYNEIELYNIFMMSFRLGLIIWWSLKKAVLVLKKWSWSWKNRSYSSWSCNLMVLLHHWLIHIIIQY